MPIVTCPTCGERGKITSNLVGVRIKCRKCGEGFQVAPAAEKPVAAGVGAAAGSAPAAIAAAVPSAAVEMQGIEVEGLDGSSWSLPTETAAAIAGAAAAAPAAAVPIGAGVAAPADGAGAGAGPAAPSFTAAREYKLLTSRDRYFDNKFDLARLEEALNHHARQGWVARSMSTPHVKGFTGVIEEVIVVLLERGPGAG